MKNFKNYKTSIAKFFLSLILVAGLSTFALASVSLETSGEYESIVNFYKVKGKKTKSHVLEFQTDNYIYVEVTGNGKTDLDVVVKDSNNEIIADDRSRESDGFVGFYVPSGGDYKISVINNGKKTNEYKMVIDVYDFDEDDDFACDDWFCW